MGRGGRIIEFDHFVFDFTTSLEIYCGLSVENATLMLFEERFASSPSERRMS